MTRDELRAHLGQLNGRRVYPVYLTFDELEDAFLCVDCKGRIYLDGVRSVYNTRDIRCVMSSTGSGIEGCEIYIRFGSGDCVILPDAENVFRVFTCGKNLNSEQAIELFRLISGSMREFSAGELVSMIEHCVKTAGVSMPEYFFDNMHRFVLGGHMTPYIDVDFVSVKYRRGRPSSDGWSDRYVKIALDNGDLLTFCAFGHAPARLETLHSGHLHTDGSPECIDGLEAIYAYFDQKGSS